MKDKRFVVTIKTIIALEHDDIWKARESVTYEVNRMLANLEDQKGCEIMHVSIDVDTV